MDINIPAILLLLFCAFGAYEHWAAYNEAAFDVEAMIAAKRNGYLLEGIKGDAREEIFRMSAKIFLSLGYLLAIFIPGSILGKGDAASVMAFVFQVGVLGSLSASTQIRRHTRRKLIQKAMAAKATNKEVHNAGA